MMTIWKYPFVVGTGHELEFNPEGYRFVGTVQTHGGSLVWHIFEWA